MFYTGDDSTARFRLDDLSGGTALGVQYDALASNLRTETVYSLGNSGILISSGGGTVTTLLEIDGDTGVLTGNRINLSLPIIVSFGAGIFSGYNRVVLHTGSRVYEIALPSGVVRDLGAMSSLTRSFCEGWAFSG